jgi:hypothetical protein
MAPKTTLPAPVMPLYAAQPVDVRLWYFLLSLPGAYAAIGTIAWALNILYILLQTPS